MTKAVFSSIVWVLLRLQLVSYKRVYKLLGNFTKWLYRFIEVINQEKQFLPLFSQPNVH